MGKHETLYVGKGIEAPSAKGMEERGVLVESVNYPSVKKGTYIHGDEVNCAVEQGDRVLFCRKQNGAARWEAEIEYFNVTIKASLFGSYKDITVTGLNTKGFTVKLKAKTKTGTYFDCFYDDLFTIIPQEIDITKFKTWMKEWGYKFELKKKGDVWITLAEWRNFILNVVFQYAFEKVAKTILNSNGPWTMTPRNSYMDYRKIAKVIQDYLGDIVGIKVTAKCGE